MLPSVPVPQDDPGGKHRASCSSGVRNDIWKVRRRPSEESITGAMHMRARRLVTTISWPEESDSETELGRYARTTGQTPPATLRSREC